MPAAMAAAGAGVTSRNRSSATLLTPHRASSLPDITTSGLPSTQSSIGALSASASSGRSGKGPSRWLERASTQSFVLEKLATQSDSCGASRASVFFQGTFVLRSFTSLSVRSPKLLRMVSFVSASAMASALGRLAWICGTANLRTMRPRNPGGTETPSSVES